MLRSTDMFYSEAEASDLAEYKISGMDGGAWLVVSP
jgi:hypothetical protein